MKKHYDPLHSYSMVLKIYYLLSLYYKPVKVDFHHHYFTSRYEKTL